jgi:hypothetical protein
MGKWIVASIVAVLLVTWWNRAAPREEIRCCVAGSITFDPATVRATGAVDQSEAFIAGLETLPVDIPAYDDAIFLDEGATMLVTAHDGKIWKVDLAGNTAEPLVNVPLMAWGIHEVPGDASHAYFCSAGSYEDRPPGEVAGLYRLNIDTRSVEPLVLEVPDTKINLQRPVVYADDNPEAPELRAGGSDGPTRKIAVCDNLEVSEDGRRIYFTEPFYYENSSADDAIDEAIALAPNGRLWRYDLDSGTTRLIAEGFHFINGVVYDLHPGQAREESVIVTQTSLFQVTRFYVSGPKAGQFEVIIDSLPGMPDGIDRDAEGRIWLAMFTDRSRLLTWVHENAWIKPLVMRIPTSLLLSQARRTGVVVLSPDGSKPLYSAFYEGPALASIASAVPAPDGIYLANIAIDNSDREQKKGIQRLQWPPELR